MLRSSKIGFGFCVENSNVEHPKALPTLVSAYTSRHIPNLVSKETKYRGHIASVERGKAYADAAD